MRTWLNGHSKSVSQMGGPWWKLGLGSDDLRAEFKAGEMLDLDSLVCNPPFIHSGLEWEHYVDRSISSLAIQAVRLPKTGTRRPVIGEEMSDCKASLRCRGIDRYLHMDVNVPRCCLIECFLKAKSSFDFNCLPTILPRLLQSARSCHPVPHPYVGATAVLKALISIGLSR